MSIVVTADDFAEFCKQHEAWLRRYIRRRMADPMLVDDALQETLLRAYRSRSTPEAGNLRPWLAVLAARACVDVWRAEPPHDRVHPGGLEDHQVEATAFVPGSDDHLAALARRRRINDALASLSPRHRRVLELQAFVGLSYEAIARESDESVPCVTSLLGRARRRFAQHYRSAQERSAQGKAVVAPVAWLRRRVGRSHEALLPRVVELAVASLAVGAAVLSGPATLSRAGTPVHASLAAPAAPAASAPPTSPAVEAGSRVVPTAPERNRRAPAAERPTEPVDDAGTPTVVVQATPDVGVTPEQSWVWIRVRVEKPVGDTSVSAGVGVRCSGSATLRAACPALGELPVTEVG